MGAEWLKIGVDGVVPVHWDMSKSTDGPGSMSGWASVYNVVDLQDEIIVAGAFKKTISDWKGSGRTIPFVLDHQHDTDGIIGSIKNLQDTPYGLKFTAEFSGTAKAQEARQKAVEGHLSGLSVFGPIIRKSMDTSRDRPIVLLHEVGLMEISLTGFPANQIALATAVKDMYSKAVSDTPWGNFSEADYSIEQWRRACLIDTGGDTSTKAGYALPVREPSGTLNRNGVHAAAARIGQVNASAEQKAAAARKLVAIYRNDLKEDPPASLLRLAGESSSSSSSSQGKSLPEEWVADMRAALSITVPVAQKAAVDALIESRYAVAADEPVDGPAEDGAADLGGEGQDDAAKFALDLVGESGPGSSSPASEPVDPLAEFFAPSEGAKASKDLDALAAEISKFIN